MGPVFGSVPPSHGGIMAETDILVRAMKDGHYGEKYRLPGDEFTIADRTAFSSVWMERVVPAVPLADPPKTPKTSKNSEKDAA